MKCEHCPLKASDRPCIAITRRVPRYCELIDPANPRHDARYAEVILSAPDEAAPSLAASPFPALGEWDYVSTGQLADDTRRLMTILPPDVDLIAAIPRSGLLPGSLLSYHLHVPLVTVSRQTGVTDPGHGGRLEGRPQAPPRHVLLIDDTAAMGREMAANFPAVRAAYPDARITRAVIYCHPRAAHAVDLFARAYPGEHYLEWNWPNAGHGSGCAYDFDGILCRDFTAEECSSDSRYRETMARIEPLFLPRRTNIPLIVTARPESTRAITLAWLTRHGVRVDRLVMRDWEWDPATDWTRRVGEWKARHYAASPLMLFAESDPAQAAIIAERTGKAVLCPTLGRVIPARPPRPLDLKTAARIEGCDFRYSACSCLDKPARCSLGGFPAIVTRADCEACVSRPS